ncbi:phage portal protein [Segniliparus rugosus]|uniref:Phage portal protein n=1 Tax=Segniliparus rugosus (strain ATCC BAA-974 / DSM 45345 / CCUG 50838 / CIP 108380 / JCM 13579 / CDC 945) TaxID=679197 RepID=E5XRT6_SEGRC|nr:phage portal protein [Segniliparus rugosus]EFV12951.1 hypothetical protein HMPREF9336_02208 [Segniliparus rugosus ATCC BAA-974]
MTDYDRHVEQLSNVLRASIGDLRESQGYLDSTYRLRTLGLGAPPEMRYLRVNVGWPSLYLRSVEERLDVVGFRVDGDDTDEGMGLLWQWWQDNNLDEESSLGHMDALTFGRSYITVAAPGERDSADSPIIRLESPLSMYAELDPRTREVTRAVRLYSSDPHSSVADSATLLLPDRTVYLKKSSVAGAWATDGKPVEHNLGVVPVVPLVNRSRLSDRYGQSEITPELRTLTDAAARTMMNLQTASELMAVPLRVFFGVNKPDLVGDGSSLDVNDVYFARILALENDQAKAFEFSAADLRNFTEELSELAKHFASYTGLPPQYLSFSSDNPASAEAMQASEARLVKTCERKARMFGGSWEQAMRIASQVMGKQVPESYNRLETVWNNPATPTYAAKADAVTKLYANGQGVIPREQAWIDMGYSVAQRDNMRAWFDEENPVSLLESMYAAQRREPAASERPGGAA